MENTNKIYAKTVDAYLGTNMNGEDVVTLKPLDKYLYDSCIESWGIVIPEELVKQSSMSLDEYMEMSTHPNSLVVPMESIGGAIDFVAKYPVIAIEGNDGSIIAEKSNVDAIERSMDLEMLYAKHGDKMKNIHIGSALNFGPANVDIGYVNGELVVNEHSDDNVFDNGCKIEKKAIFYYESDVLDINQQPQDFADKFIADSQKLHNLTEMDADTQFFFDHCSNIHMNDVVIVYGDASDDYEIIACAIDDSVIQELDSVMQQYLKVDEEDLEL